MNNMNEVVYRAIMDVYESSDKLAVKVYEHGQMRAIVLVGGPIEGTTDDDMMGILLKITEDQTHTLQLMTEALMFRNLDRKKDTTIN